MTPPITALYDACVLYPAPLRDLLMHLATKGFVHARWTDAIHDEWIESLLKNRPDLSRERLERTRQRMNETIGDSLVAGYEHRVVGLALPDPNDLHVLAAAIECGAQVIVTYDLGDFPEATLRSVRIRAEHPDEFVRSLLSVERDAVVAAVRKQRSFLTNPPKSVEQLLSIFEKLRLSKTVEELRSVDPEKL